MNLFKYKKKEKGFSILLTLIIASTFLIIGMFIAIIAYKELLISYTAKVSQIAFYTTNTAIECAMFQDKIGNFKRNNLDTGPGHFYCNNARINIMTNKTQSGDNFAVTVFEGSLVDSTDQTIINKSPFIRVRIVKMQNTITQQETTIIESWARNRKEGGRGVVERSIRVSY